MVGGVFCLGPMVVDHVAGVVGGGAVARMVEGPGRRPEAPGRKMKGGFGKTLEEALGQMMEAVRGRGLR